MELDIKLDPDTDPAERLQTDGKKISEAGVKPDSGHTEEVIVLTEAVDATVKEGEDRGGSESKFGIPVKNPDSGVSALELEKALERVVDRLFTQKIEGMITAIIDRALNREIAKLKRAFLDDEFNRDETTGP